VSREVLESCLSRVSNKFELVLLASVRARKIASQGNMAGVMLTSPGRAVAIRKGDLRYQKAPLLALKEIASGINDLEDVRQECRSGDRPESAPKPVAQSGQGDLGSDENGS